MACSGITRDYLAALIEVRHAERRQMKSFSESSERNRGPILEVLKRIFSKSRFVLEIGSGTGQHAAYFAPELTHLVWQASDVADNLPGICEWVKEAGVTNLREPIALDVDQDFPSLQVDAVFSANTCHIMSWSQVERMFEGIGKIPSLKVFCLYGPFNYGGKYTSDSNARFDAMLRGRDPNSGLRNVEDLVELGKRAGLSLEEDNPMPANNRLLVFKKQLD